MRLPGRADETTASDLRAAPAFVLARLKRFGWFGDSNAARKMRSWSMTPDRMKYLMEAGLRRRRQNGEPAHINHCAKFLGVTPQTMRRWEKGDPPPPRWAEIIMEGFHAWPEVFNPQAVDKLIEERDNGVNNLEVQKQH